MNGERVNISDVAKRAGVAKGTVSRVLNNYPNSGISEATRVRVKQVVAELNYAPHIGAASLAGKRTHIIGVLIVNVNNPFASHFVSSLEDRADKSGYTVILCNTRRNVEREKEKVQMLRQRGIEGVIIEHIGSPDLLSDLEQQNYPFVLLDRCPELPHLDYVTFNDVEGGRLATKALIDVGCKTIAHIAGEKMLLTTADRAEGYRLALQQSGLLPNEGLIVYTERCDDYLCGYECACKLLDGENRPDGIFCFTDHLAFGVFQAAAERGLVVGKDLAVIGYNDEIFASVPWNPVQLASVRLDMDKLGSEAARMLLRKIKSELEQRESEAMLITPEVMPRASLGLIRP